MSTGEEKQDKVQEAIVKACKRLGDICRCSSEADAPACAHCILIGLQEGPLPELLETVVELKRKMERV